MSEPRSARERLFPGADELEAQIPDPPSRWQDMRMEWRLGYVAGWETGTGRAAGSLADKQPQKHRVFLYGVRAGAHNAGKSRARDDKRAIIAELWPLARERGRAHSQVSGNFLRHGVAWQGVFFYPFSNMKLPAVDIYREGET